MRSHRKGPGSSGRADHQAEDQRGADDRDGHRGGERDQQQEAELDLERIESASAARQHRGEQQWPPEDRQRRQADERQHHCRHELVGADPEHLTEQQRIDLGRVLAAKAEEERAQAEHEHQRERGRDVATAAAPEQPNPECSCHREHS